MNRGERICDELIGKDEIWETVLMTRQEILNMFDISILIDLPCENVMNMSRIIMYIYRVAAEQYDSSYSIRDISLMMPFYCDWVVKGLNAFLSGNNIYHRHFYMNYSDGNAEVRYA